MSTVFNPAEVPTYPVVPIELRAVEGDGTQQVYVNGQHVPVPDGMTPYRAGIEAASQEAAKQIGGAVRVNATTSNGKRFRLVVQDDGTVFELPDKPSRRRRSKVLPAVIAVGALTMTTAIGGAVILARSRHATTPTATQPATAPPAELPVVPATGWSSHARWASAPLLGTTDHATPVVAGNTVVVPTTDGLDAISVSTGETAWSSSLPNQLSAGPTHTYLENGPRIVAQSQNQLLWWPETGATDPQTIDLPEGSQLSFEGASPLVQINDTHAATIGATGAVQQRVVPTGATALAANTDGSVTAASDSGMWWHLTNPDVARDGKPLSPPSAKAHPAKVMGYLSHYLIMLWQTPGAHTSAPTYTAVIYDDTHNMRPLRTVKIGTDIPTWTASPSRSWGILGHTLIDLKRRKAHNLGTAWSTTSCNNIQCYSSNGSSASAVDHQGRVSSSNSDGTPPAWVLNDGSGLIYGQENGTDSTTSHIYLTPHQK